MRVLVTGGSGHIGTKVVEALEHEHHDVWIMDVAEPQKPTRKFMPMSVDDPNVPTEIFHALGKVPSAVVHLAGVLGTEELWDDVPHAIDVNIRGTARVLEGCRQAGARYVGIETGTPWKTPYSITKRAARELAEGYNRRYNLDTTTLRVFNVYGNLPSLPSKVLPRFIEAALNDDPLEVYFGGFQALDLIHVDDVVEAIMQAVTVGSDGEVLDVGSGVARSVREFAELVIKLAESSSPVVEVPNGRPSEGLEHPVANVARTLQVLGWEPSDADDETFSRHVAEAVQWYQLRLTPAVS